MRARCLRPFRLSRDGVTATPVAEGEHVDVPATLAPGLVAEGFIVAAADVPHSPVLTKEEARARLSVPVIEPPQSDDPMPSVQTQRRAKKGQP